MLSAECPECKKIYHGWSLKYSSEKSCPVCGKQLVPEEKTKNINKNQSKNISEPATDE
jgi:hypothetical protein